MIVLGKVIQLPVNICVQCVYILCRYGQRFNPAMDIVHINHYIVVFVLSSDAPVDLAALSFFAFYPHLQPGLFLLLQPLFLHHFWLKNRRRFFESATA